MVQDISQKVSLLETICLTNSLNNELENNEVEVNIEVKWVSSW